MRKETEKAQRASGDRRTYGLRGQRKERGCREGGSHMELRSNSMHCWRGWGSEQADLGGVESREFGASLMNFSERVF